MQDRDRATLTRKGRMRRFLFYSTAAVAATGLAGLAVSQNIEDAYISTPEDDIELHEEGYTVKGYATTLKGEPSLFVAVSKVGSNIAYPQVDKVDFVREPSAQVYRPWIRTGVTFRELGSYSVLLYRMSKSATERFESYVEDGRYDPIPIQHLKPQYP